MFKVPFPTLVLPMLLIAVGCSEYESTADSSGVDFEVNGGLSLLTRASDATSDDILPDSQYIPVVSLAPPPPRSEQPSSELLEYGVTQTEALFTAFVESSSEIETDASDAGSTDQTEQPANDSENEAVQDEAVIPEPNDDSRQIEQPISQPEVATIQDSTISSESNGEIEQTNEPANEVDETDIQIFVSDSETNDDSSQISDENRQDDDPFAQLLMPELMTSDQESDANAAEVTSLALESSLQIEPNSLLETSANSSLSDTNSQPTGVDSGEEEIAQLLTVDSASEEDAISTIATVEQVLVLSEELNEPNSDSEGEALGSETDPVFPGAEGFGVYTRAGKDGFVCKVTNLWNSGEGSLRKCLSSTGARTVVFDVSGTIKLDSTLEIENPFVSVLGQTAPQGGIMLTVDASETGPVMRIVTHDVLIQHLRIRAGKSDEPSCCRDALSIGTEVPDQVYNIVIDHNSLSWGTDEIIDIEYDARDITVSYNIISEGFHESSNNIDGPAGRGMLVGHQSTNISIHHNLFANTYQRNPYIRGVGTTDFVNNIIYHAVSRGTQVEARNGDNNVNLVNNLYIPHIDGQPQPSNTNWFDVLITVNPESKLSLYMKGNLGFWRRDQDEPEWKIAGVDWSTPYDPSMGIHTTDRHWAPPVTEYPTESLESILSEEVGATLPMRDTVDQRVISEFWNRSGLMPDCILFCDRNIGGWPTIE